MAGSSTSGKGIYAWVTYPFVLWSHLTLKQKQEEEILAIHEDASSSTPDLGQSNPVSVARAVQDDDPNKYLEKVVMDGLFTKVWTTLVPKNLIGLLEGSLVRESLRSRSLEVDHGMDPFGVRSEQR